MSRKLTHIEDVFLRQVILEVNGAPVMLGTNWCRARRALGGNHKDCPNFKTCLVFFRCQYRIRLGLDISTADFEVPQIGADFVKWSPEKP